MARTRGGVVATLAGTALLGLFADGQNLLSNPDFDSGISGWTSFGGGSWQFDGQNGSPSAGSIVGTNTDTGYISLSQCVPVTAERIYRFGARCQVWGSVSGNGGQCSTSVSWYASADCSGASLDSTSALPPAMSLGWTDSTGSSVARPQAKSAEVNLQIWKPSTPAGEVQARFDSTFLYRDVKASKGDFDGDGHVDLVLHNITTGEDRVWLMNGVERVSTQLFGTQPADELIVGCDDFNQDGFADLVYRANTSAEIDFHLMQGASQIANPYGRYTLSEDPPSGWLVAASGDFDRDGWPDLLLRQATTQQLVVWTLHRGMHLGTLIPTPDHAVDANWSAAAALDFDNDGNRDLLWYNATSGKIVLWRLDANLVRTAGEFTSPASAGDNNWRVLAGGDYGPGAGGVASSNDIVWRNATSGKFVVWHMDPASVPLTRTSGEFTNPDGPTSNPTDWTIVGPR